MNVVCTSTHVSKASGKHIAVGIAIQSADSWLASGRIAPKLVSWVDASGAVKKGDTFDATHWVLGETQQMKPKEGVKAAFSEITWLRPR